MTHEEIQREARFAFGANWASFLNLVNDERVREAEKSLKIMLKIEKLHGKKFLDVGSGSGLFSLAARRLGAEVYSFDYDKKSVACTAELRRRYFPNDTSWKVTEGSVLDTHFVSGLGVFDYVYSWGVLHHTGAMWTGIEHAISRVGTEGRLFIAIYNDQGWKSHLWWFIKAFYNMLPWPVNQIWAYAFGFGVMILNIIKYTVKLNPMKAIGPLVHYKKRRGMSLMHDMVDWMGGFPFEFARFDVLQKYMFSRGFELEEGKCADSLGCHEMVFKRRPSLKRDII